MDAEHQRTRRERYICTHMYEKHRDRKQRLGAAGLLMSIDIWILAAAAAAAAAMEKKEESREREREANADADTTAHTKSCEDL